MDIVLNKAVRGKPTCKEGLSASEREIVERRRKIAAQVLVHPACIDIYRSSASINSGKSKKEAKYED